MRQLLASMLTLLLTTSIAWRLDAQTKAEIDELIYLRPDIRRSHLPRIALLKRSRR